MRKRNVIFSLEAKVDIVNLKRYIKQELKMPDTASNYIKELIATIQKCSIYAGSIGRNEYVQAAFGQNVRHITFRKMAIIFFAENDTVYIQRVIPASHIR